MPLFSARTKSRSLAPARDDQTIQRGEDDFFSSLLKIRCFQRWGIRREGFTLFMLSWLAGARRFWFAPFQLGYSSAEPLQFTIFRLLDHRILDEIFIRRRGEVAADFTWVNPFSKVFCTL